MSPVPQRWDAIATAEAVRSGEVSAREVVETAVERIEKQDPELNVMVSRRFDEALAEVDAGLPDGPLRGVPVLIKDLGMQVAGLPHTRGSRLWLDDVADQDSELVRRYKAAGMVVLGTTNTPELGKNGSTEPVVHGPTHNPWARGYSSGGSSGGSAAAVAAGMVPVAHGNDGGGSIRIPASMSGLFGLKPTRGRVTSAPLSGGLSQPLSINHALTRSVRDSALLLDLAAAPMPGAAGGSSHGGPGAAGAGDFLSAVDRDPGPLRIGLVTERADGGVVDDQVLAAVRQAAALCEELGHRVEETRFGHDPALAMQGFATLMGVTLVAQVEDRLAALGRELADDDLEPFSRMMLDHYSSTLTPADVYRALGAIERTGWQLGRQFEQYDVLLSPTVPLPVPEHGVLDTTRVEVMWERGGDYSSFTAIANITGSPGMSVPWSTDSAGLPVGVQFLADLGREDLLLSLAGRLEEARPWSGLAPAAG